MRNGTETSIINGTTGAIDPYEDEETDNGPDDPPEYPEHVREMIEVCEKKML